MAAKPITPGPPEHLPEDVRDAWREIVADGLPKSGVDAMAIEAYATLVVRWRATARAIAEEGIVVDGGRRGAIAHPALAVERALADQIKVWAAVFRKRPPVRRRSGPVYDATKKSVAAVPALQSDQFAGAVEAVLTLAWLIDEAQRDGIEELQKRAFVLIPSYLKGCAELQITPASLPAETGKKVTGGGKVTKFADAAAARRRQAGIG